MTNDVNLKQKAKYLLLQRILPMYMTQSKVILLSFTDFNLRYTQTSLQNEK